VRLGLIGLLYVAGWAAVLVLGSSWYQLLVAVYLAVVFTQVAFLGHDVGHRQVFRSRRLNRVVGEACGNLGTGISYRYWVDKHNQHHARPNQIGADPDVGPGVISWTAEQVAAKTGPGRVIARHQAALFFPLASLEAVSLHVASARSVCARSWRRASTEAVLLGAHAVAYLSVVFLVLPPLRAAAFIVLQQGVFGLYLGCAFAPNHKGMTMPLPGEHLGFVRRQVTTSRNVKGGRVLTVALGGLNYQIEHHLFPSMPMANLRRCQPIVRAYCSAHGIDYCETGLAGSYLVALRYLRRTGRSGGVVVPLG
jgi:fatty acid desaturase